MLKKEQILKVLKKYGFYSLNRAPYLYQNKEELGVYFVWPNSNFGNLERVLFFYDEETLDEEVYKYWWFLNNKNNVNVIVEFDDYEKLNPKINYKLNNKILTATMMKHFSDIENTENESDIIKKKQLIRTANILILILREKFKLQNETYFKVLELQETLKQLTNTYNKKLNQYNKSNEDTPESYELLMDENDESEKLANTLSDELASLNTTEEVRTFIESMFTYLSNIDSSEIHLQNVYLLNRYPYEIEDIKAKIDILENALKAKRRLFGAKQNVPELLGKVDSNSQCKKMINVNLYIEKEKKRIQEKYENRDQIDENILGDYLLNFEKMNIEVPSMIEVQNNSVVLEKEELLKALKEKYEKLNKKEKSACHVATSFLGECLNILSEIENIDILTTSDIISNLVLSKNIDRFNEAFQALDNYLNAKIRVKYFSVLKIDTFETFIESLISVINILKNINIKLSSSFKCYYHIKNKEIIPLYLKNLSYLEGKQSYLVEVKSNVPVYYSPVQIVKPLDIVENVELDLRENEVVFLLHQTVNIESDSRKIKVVKYEKDKVVKRKDCIAVTDMKEKSICVYLKDVVEPLES